MRGSDLGSVPSVRFGSARRPSAMAFMLVSRVVDWFTFDFAEKVVGGLGPGERFGAFVVAVDVGADRGLQVGDVGEGAAADGLAGDDAEEDLDHVQPRAAGRRECIVTLGFLSSQAWMLGCLWVA